jgi:hypothetical protein
MSTTPQAPGPDDWADLTPQGFCDALEATGLMDAELLCHGGPGMPAIPTIWLPDGRGALVSDPDGCLTDTDDIYTTPLSAVAGLGCQVYESQAENAPRWAADGGRGLVLNDPAGLLWGPPDPGDPRLLAAVPVAVIAAALIAAAGGDYSAFAPAQADPPRGGRVPQVEWARTTDGRLVFDRRTREYLRAVQWTGPDRLRPWRTVFCTECGRVINGDGLVTDDADGGGHVVIDGAVVLGCEGYWQIDPDAVGLDRGGWDDWRLAYAQHEPGMPAGVGRLEDFEPDGEPDGAYIIDGGPGYGYSVTLIGEHVGDVSYRTYPDALAALRAEVAEWETRWPHLTGEPLRVFFCNPATGLRLEFPVPLAEVRVDWDRPTRPADVAWWAALPPHIGVEAFCLLCGETCNPHGADDMVHGQTWAEEPCGGPLVLVGAWGIEAGQRPVIPAARPLPRRPEPDRVRAAMAAAAALVISREQQADLDPVLGQAMTISTRAADLVMAAYTIGRTHTGGSDA